eukprot:scaffold52133_cov62-Phaeocystis_antarctica.AAC.2
MQATGRTASAGRATVRASIGRSPSANGRRHANTTMPRISREIFRAYLGADEPPPPPACLSALAETCARPSRDAPTTTALLALLSAPRPVPTARARPVTLSIATWDELEARLPSSLAAEPLVIDAALARDCLAPEGHCCTCQRRAYRAYLRTVRVVAPQDRERPALTDGGLVLYRERNGWCPYSERVWLALEHKGIAYETEP